jgi:hypothetical protein
MAVVVSINGVGSLEKTPQIHLLPSDWRILCLGDILDDDLDLRAKLAAADWWWKSSADEFVSEIFKAVVQRHSRAVDAGNSAHRLAVLQCGANMFEAVALAMIALKEKHEDLAAAKAAFDIIIAKLGLTIPKEHHAILIKHADLDDAAEMRQSFDDITTTEYSGKIPHECSVAVSKCLHRRLDFGMGH